MSISDFKDIVDAQNSAIESFLAVSRLYLTSSERLLALNVAVGKAAIADGGAIFKALAGMTSPADLQRVQADLAVPRIDKMLSYARSCQEIAAQAQDELTQLMLAAFPFPDQRMPTPNSWPTVIAALTKREPPRKANGSSAATAPDRKRA